MKGLFEMKKMIAVVAALAIAAAFAVTGCGSKTTNELGLVKDGTLTMVTEATYPPFESLDGNKVVGFDVDMAQAIADKLGLKLEVKQMDFELLVAAVEAGTDCDIAVAGMGVTDERLESVDFSDLYYSDELAIAVLKTSGITAANLDDMIGTGKIAVQTGTTGEAQMKEDYPNATIVSLTKTNDCFAGLLTGEYVAVCTNAAVVKSMIAGTYGDATIVKSIATGEEYAIAISKEDTALKAAINKAIAELQADGTIEALLAKWGL